MNKLTEAMHLKARKHDKRYWWVRDIRLRTIEIAVQTGEKWWSLEGPPGWSTEAEFREYYEVIAPVRPVTRVEEG